MSVIAPPVTSRDLARSASGAGRPHARPPVENLGTARVAPKPAAAAVAAQFLLPGVLAALFLLAATAHGASLVKTSQSDFQQSGCSPPADCPAFTNVTATTTEITFPLGTACSSGCTSEPGNSPAAPIGAGTHAIRRGDGRFLIINGGNRCDTTAFDPAQTNPFSAGPPLSAPCGTPDQAGTGAHSFLRDDGELVIVHGGARTRLSLYDPATDIVAADSLTLTGNAGSGAHTIKVTDSQFLIVHGASTTATTVYKKSAGVYAAAAGPATCDGAGYVGAGAHSVRLSATRWVLIRAHVDAPDPRACYLDYNAGLDTLSFTDGSAGPAFPGAEVLANGAHSILYAANAFFVVLGGGVAGTLRGTIAPDATVTFEAAGNLAGNADNGTHSIQRPDLRFLVLHGSSSSVFDPAASTAANAPGPALPVSLGVGAHALQVDDGRYLVLFGGAGTSARFFDDGFAVAGEYLTEKMAAASGFDAWHVLSWNATPGDGGSIGFRVGSATSSAARPGSRSSAPTPRRHTARAGVG
ncbi:MAG: hypothetical protein HYV63_08060 [Candidatus Schekmanbacteria bacterium]|nr:hypothetical protein [Candidatus Schekmanbacteria bacterium]